MTEAPTGLTRWTADKLLRPWTWMPDWALLIGALVVITGAIVIFCFWAVNATSEDPHVEVKRAGNTFTVIGHEGPDKPSDWENPTARAAGSVCARNGMRTRDVFRVGDLRIIVTCE